MFGFQACILDAGSRIPDPRCRVQIQDPGSYSRILDPGSWIPDPGSRILGSRIQYSGSWLRDIKQDTIIEP